MSKKKRHIPTWLHAPAFLAVRTAMLPMGVCDLGECVAMARAAARLYAGARMNRKRLSRAIENLHVAFPDWERERRRECAIRSYEHLFTLAVEAAVMPRLLNEDGWSSHVSLGNMRTSVLELLGRGYPGGVGARKACMLITGHSGNWELLGYTMALLGFPMHALFRPLDMKPVDEWMRRTRQSRGLVLVDKFGATESLPRLMSRGFPIGFVADQNGGDRGLFVPFFDRLASAYKSIGLLALKYESPIICGQARRLVHDVSGESRRSGGVAGFSEFQGEPMRYQIDVVDVIDPGDWADQPDPVFYITARYRRAIEMMVRQAPEQYLWMHRYWKSRPRHEHQGKPIPRQMREKIERLPWMTQEKMDRIVAWSERDAGVLAQRTS
ncbi:MAG: lysophospholipid acyltransferase family protein [Phycisphaerales bacterium]